MLRRLLADEAYERVTAFVRKELPESHRKLVQRVVDFDRLAELADFPRAQDVFCCLGTTMNRAGSPAAFRRVDFTYVRELARVASQHRASQFLLVSALGANPTSRVFYNRVKGEAEEAVRRFPFDGIHIFRPSLLLGERAEVRLGELIAITLSRGISFALIGPLGKYRPIEAAAVARAMIAVARRELRGVDVFESDRIRSLADG